MKLIKNILCYFGQHWIFGWNKKQDPMFLFTKVQNRFCKNCRKQSLFDYYPFPQ